MRRHGAAVVVFIITSLLSALLLWQTQKARLEGERARAMQAAANHAHLLQLNLEQALSATYTVAALLKLGNGDIKDFEATARTMLSFYPGASALELAPKGIVRKVEPLAGNERALGHNLLTDPQRDKEAFAARDTGRLTLAGPFPLVQGGTGVAGRLPVYLETEGAGQSFWGFVVVLVRFPEALKAARFNELSARGYDYMLWRRHPDSGNRQVIASSTNAEAVKPVEVEVRVPNATWTLSVWPASGWGKGGRFPTKLGFAVLFVALATLAASRLAPARRNTGRDAARS
ncbi:MAG TPA: CHASE domain-containing protein [Noviherbaspirillum sp.]|uniref:CHASE domain-containing protein n=1 Tax=Noviherbaspirillum sp. TaxID=1926288 RepID=UPI002D6AE81E|nr:CHASE domain-containing protein [Noviherbaspirillum sp.]HYD96536.1 CHASE domain-containing protein [Noviherbaspirillum sp.]